MFVVMTGLRSTVAIGTDRIERINRQRDTVTGAGLGEGPAKATPLMSKQAVTASVMLFQFV